ncbi:MAG: MlaD family protein [Pseudomonadota bacterium]
MTISDSENQAIINSKRRISFVWVIPIMALVFGGYLAYKAVMERGTMVSLVLESSEGIIPGKTEIRYRGLVMGLVKDIQLDSSMQKVIANIEMKPTKLPIFNERTLFWLVRPQVTFAGISGLETLLSGNYIALRPFVSSALPAKYQFVALSEPPPLPEETPGLHLKLFSEKLSSLGPGSQVSFRQIPVGSVTSYRYDNQSSQVEIDVHIQPEFAHLVNENTRFWNASGINIEGGVSGVKVETESFASIMTGGIAFDTYGTADSAKLVSNYTQFKLFPNFDEAKLGLEITLLFEWGSSITKNMPIIFEGVELGEIADYTLADDDSGIIAVARVDPRIKPILKSETKFFVVSPKISASGIDNLDTMFSGNYISLTFSRDGEDQTTFKVSKRKPRLGLNVPGLHLSLQTPHIDSLEIGAPLFYRKKKVGDIQDIRVDTDKEQFFVDVFIEPGYAKLVNQQTRFWNASGFSLRGSLNEIEIKTESVMSILTGGIAFENVDIHRDAELAVNGEIFRLYSDRYDAEFSIEAKIQFHSTAGIRKRSTKVKYKGEIIGEVKDIEKDENNKPWVTVGLKPHFHWLLKKKTRFWLEKPMLFGSTVNDFIDGTFIGVKPGKGKASKIFIAKRVKPIVDHSAPGLQLKILTEEADSLGVGSKVLHRKVAIGHVENIRHTKDKRNIEVMITIDEAHRKLLSENSRFYIAGGLDIQGDLSGVEVRTESLSAIVTGGLGVYTPKKSGTKSLREGHTFTMYPSFKSAKFGKYPITIDFPHAQGLSAGMQIRYATQQVGEVIQLNFNEDLTRVSMKALLYEFAQDLAREGSKIWLDGPRVGLVGNKNWDAVLVGQYLGISKGSGKLISHYHGEYEAPAIKQFPSGLNIKLQSVSRYSIVPDNPVYYRHIEVGRVIGTELDAKADIVNIYINIHDKYRPLVREGSRFWAKSGLKISAGIFSGIAMNTDSMESILAGGIQFATPPLGTSGVPVGDGHAFELNAWVKQKWLDWDSQVLLDNAGLSLPLEMPNEQQ